MTEAEMTKYFEKYVNTYGENAKNRPWYQLYDALKNSEWYENITNVEYLDSLQDMLDNRDIKLEPQDYIPITTRDYWNQPNNETFNYVARVLPMVRRKDSTAYSDIFNQDTGKLLPAGLNKKNDPSAETIWNRVEQIDEGDRWSSSRSEDSEKRGIDRWKTTRRADKPEAVERGLTRIEGGQGLSRQQLNAVVAYIDSIIGD